MATVTFSIMKGLIVLGSSYHFQAGLGHLCLSPLAFAGSYLDDTFGANCITEMVTASVLACDNWLLSMRDVPSC